MSNAMEKSWKNRLQEYCQKNKLRLPNYRIKQESSAPNKINFQVEVEIDGRWYIGEENCTSKKDAEHSAAEKAYADLNRNNVEVNITERSRVDSVVHNNNSSQHMPPEYADVEQFITNMVLAFGGRIRKVQGPDVRGRYRLEIGGNYHYCENIQGQHKKNRVYFLVDPVQKIYFQKCYDPDCQGFQSAKKKIYVHQTSNDEEVNNLTGA